MNEQDERVTNDDYDDEITWNELLEELTKKHGNIPQYLYKAISETPESSATSSYEDTEVSREEVPDEGLSNLEAHRRSPGVDSGCSVGFNEDDDDDEYNEHSLNDNSIKKIWKDLQAIRDATISLAKQFIYVFDLIEDVKYMNESTSSRESLSSSASGSQDPLSLPQRQRKFNLRKLSRSVPNARGACPQLISRHQRKRSQDLRLRLFQESLDQLDKTKAASAEEKINETADGRSLRRASDDSLAMNLKVTESSHRRSNSLSYGEKKEDQWMQNLLDFDAQHRSVLNFAELLRAQNDEINNHFSLEGRPRNNDMIHHGPVAAISVDDISVQVDIVLESQLPDGIDLDNVSDKYNIGERESSSADEIGKDCLNGNRSPSILKDEKQNETNSVSDDNYVIQNSDDSRRGRKIDTTCNDASNDDLRESNLETDSSSNHDDNWGKHKEVTIGNNLVHNSNVQDASNNAIQKSLASGDSPRKSWLHGEGRSSYNERMKPKPAEEPMIRARSHSLHANETKVSDDYDDGSDDDPYETQTDQRKDKPTQPKKRPKILLKRSPTYHETRPQQKQSPLPSKDINFSNTVSPRYFQLLLMLEEGEATDL